MSRQYFQIGLKRASTRARGSQGKTADARLLYSLFLCSSIKYADYSFVSYYASRRPFSRLSLSKGATKHEKGRRSRVSSTEGSGRWTYFTRQNTLNENNRNVWRNAEIKSDSFGFTGDLSAIATKPKFWNERNVNSISIQ